MLNAQTIELMQRQLSQFGRVGATKLLRHQAQASIAAAGTGSPPPIRIREPGTVIALYGQVLTAVAADMAGTEVRIFIGGTEELCTDGQIGQSMPFLMLFGANQNWFPLIRHVVPGDDWVFQYTNNNPANAIVPSLALAFIADSALEDLPRSMSRAGAG